MARRDTDSPPTADRRLSAHPSAAQHPPSIRSGPTTAMEEGPWTMGTEALFSSSIHRRWVPNLQAATVRFEIERKRVESLRLIEAVGRNRSEKQRQKPWAVLSARSGLDPPALDFPPSWTTVATVDTALMAAVKDRYPLDSMR